MNIFRNTAKFSLLSQFDSASTESLAQEQALIVTKVDTSEFFYFQVSGVDPPKPVSSFGHLGFDETMINAIIKAGYSTPTPIQAQVRIANGRNYIYKI